MASFEKLFEEILHQRPDLNKGSLLKMIDEKKMRVGAGYLTDQGALFLVASDLGISLDQVASSDLTLKDLYVGANEITIVGRVLTIYPLRKYVKKDGSEGQYRWLVLFDGNVFAQVTLWDDKAGIIDDLKLQSDDVVRVVKGYVKAGLDSRPVLNVGSRGSLELVVDRKITDTLHTLKDITKDVSNVKVSETFLSIQGVVTSPPKLSEYIKRNGAPGKLIQLHLRSPLSGRETRVAIWNNDSPSLITLQPHSAIQLVNLKSRLILHGEVELHGDESTFVKVLSTPPPPIPLPPKTPQPRVLRILSQGMLQEDGDERFHVTALVADKTGNLFTLIARGDAGKRLQDMTNDRLIECTPLDSGPSTLICEHDVPITPQPKEDSAYLSSSAFTYKINKIKEVTTPIFLEVIALSKTTIQDITTKDGSIVKRAEVVVGDETGEIKMVAWRNLTSMLEGIAPGQRLRLNAMMNQKGRDGTPTLQVRPYSSINRIS